MSDQTEAAIAAGAVHKHTTEFLEQLGAVTRFLCAMRILWLRDEAKRIEEEADSLKWKLPSGYLDQVRLRSDEKMRAAS